MAEVGMLLPSARDLNALLMKPERLDRELGDILRHLVKSEKKIDQQISNVHKLQRLGAKNLCRYLILRSYDLRRYHDSLSDLGLSALRSSEGYVMSNLQNVVNNLQLIQGLPPLKFKKIELIGYQKSKKLVTKSAARLFPTSDKKRYTKIMVTLPDEEATDAQLIGNMADSGMDIARINLGHGNMDMWRQMVEHIHLINAGRNQPVLIYVDLAGPKIRTSKIAIVDASGNIKDSIPVREGDHILLTKRKTEGRTSSYDSDNTQLEKAEIGVMLDAIIDNAHVGDEVLFDDGMIKAAVVEKRRDDLELELIHCFKAKLSSNKGINLPHTKLHLPALTERDLEYLPFVCEHADILGYSFVRTREDVAELNSQLAAYGKKTPGVVFKIENKEAFENLPQILLEGMQRPNIGVMIARGDLAVEIGFDRISEVQNEILWLCQAAYVPAIWATQVLENLAKSGIPTRAEISDAAQGSQAECVMLNKGPHINDAIYILKDILGRMERHSFKKKTTSRALHIARNAVKKLQLA